MGRGIRQLDIQDADWGMVNSFLGVLLIPGGNLYIAVQYFLVKNVDSLINLKQFYLIRWISLLSSGIFRATRVIGITHLPLAASLLTRVVVSVSVSDVPFICLRPWWLFILVTHSFPEREV